MISLSVLPVYMIQKIWSNFSTLEDEDTIKEHGYIYEDLGTKSKLQASFHVVYIIRRAIYAIILVYFEMHSSLQLCGHMLLTMGYIIYFAHI